MVGWKRPARSTRLAAWLMIASVAFVAAGTGTGVAAGGKIQPGDWAQTGAGSCTLNFVFDGTGSQSGKTYIGIAAHCVDGIGDRVRTAPEGFFGEVAYIGDENSARDDFAFIEFFDGADAFAGVRGYDDQYPVDGHTTPGDTGLGDLVQISGYGMGYDATPITREERVGSLTFDDRDIYRLYGPIHFGDSGGPLVHVESGKALGIVSRLPIFPPCTCSEEGPTVEGMIDKAADDGFTVRLRTI